MRKDYSVKEQNVLQTLKHDFFRGFNQDHQRLNQFQNKIEFDFIIGTYQIKTATTKKEVISSLQLRHLVFYQELLQKNHPTGLDIDRYDTFFDHIVVIDKKTTEVIATYRILCSKFSEDFYSKSEFNLDQIKLLNSPLLEVGRACVHPNYRKSTVLSCLWRGISEYLKLSGSQTLLGCGSIKTEDPKDAALMTLYFEKNKMILPQITCEPLAPFKIIHFNQILSLQRNADWTSAEDQKIKDLLPPLFRSYLKAGALVTAEPAWDRDFKCVDYLIFLDTQNLLGTYEKRFF